MPYLTRFATEDDLAPILQLSEAVQSNLIAQGSPRTLETPCAALAARAIQAQQCFVFVDGDSARDVVAAAFTKSLPDQPFDFIGPRDSKLFAAKGDPVWHLYSVILRPDLQGHGIGSNFIGDILRLIGHGTISLDCFEGNRKLRDFYERQGFELFGIAREEDYLIAVYMKDL